MAGLLTDFVLPVDKPEGPTSHDVVGAARRGLGEKRVGHTGTLDPFASGLLILCVGRTTRLAEYFSGMDKSYDAEAHLGVCTDTLDRDGEVTERAGGWEDLTEERIAVALAGLRGEIEQVPPAYSAKKVDGERAYQRARKGQEVALQPCAVVIRSLDLVSMDLPRIRFEVTCSSGTYVRALARDIGSELGVGAHLSALRRTSVGHWQVGDAMSLEELSDPERVAAHAVRPLAAVAHLPKLEVDDEAARRLVLGQSVELKSDAPTGLPLAVAHAGDLLAIGEAQGGLLRPKKVFAA